MVTMTRGKPIQQGVRAKLPAGAKSWEDLGAMSPEAIRERRDRRSYSLQVTRKGRLALTLTSSL